MGAPGDMKNNLKILETEVRYMKYPEELDLEGVTKGKPQAFLPLYSHAFNNYSPEFTAEVVQLLDEGLYGKSDLRFMEAVYRVLRDMFNYKPSITKDQFFSTSGFAERKVMMCGDVLRLIRERSRNYGPHKPTNPNIKVSAVIDNRRTSKGASKQSLDSLVSVEPANTTVNRKVAQRPITAPNSLHKGLSAKGMAGMGVDEGTHLARSHAGRGTSPPRASLTNNAVEVVSMPATRSPDSGHPRVVDVLAKSPEHSINEPPLPRDHRTDAMETILSKVRDLPTQLASFMQAVEGRLQKVEERLSQVEESAKQKPTSVSVDEMGRETEEELRQQMETLRSRLILLENRITLAESKAQTKDMKELAQVARSHEKMECENVSSPFGALERGGFNPAGAKKHSSDDSFASSLVKNFSPIRREGTVFCMGNDTTLSEPDPRRSSTPTHPQYTAMHSSERVRQAGENVGEPVTELSSSFRTLGLDTSTQQQVDRIKGLLHSTKMLLPTPDNPANGSA
ncbi:hypothetical protein BaRGS_00034214 [Batillaria attramentaria]|uniref:Centrosomal protein of 44 kDa n=1 Tax=Batillaria attramentaria TaxID=370345 RepID=A0ABD0JIE1_9CAEN